MVLKPVVNLNHSSAASAGSDMKRPINLLRGWPSPTLLPSVALGAKAWNVLNKRPEPAPRSLLYQDLEINEKALLYGPDEGHLPLRKSLGEW